MHPSIPALVDALIGDVFYQAILVEQEDDDARRTTLARYMVYAMGEAERSGRTVTLDDPAGATLTATWSWGANLLTEEIVRDLAERWFAALGALVRHVAHPGAGGRTPSDLPLVVLSQAEIERLEKKHAR